MKMKIQCNVCEVTEANVLCCADEAALCYGCDEKVHAANKLASKHQRVSLTASSVPMPKCDICQESVGYFFCLEDRALLCRKCDVAIHSISTYVSAHQRFLLTGVKVGLESTECKALSSSGKSNTAEEETEQHHSSRKKINAPLSTQQSSGLTASVGGVCDFQPMKLSFAGGSASGIQQWPFDENFGLGELGQNYSYIVNGSSKGDDGKLGDSECSLILRVDEVELDSVDYLGQVPEAAWAVPEIPSHPWLQDLTGQKVTSVRLETSPAFVPDICWSPMLNPCYGQQDDSSFKRRRQF